MRARPAIALLAINIMAILLIIIISFFPDNVLRIILGLPFALFFPGYALIAALFPGGKALSAIERGALSLGLSVVAVILIGIVLNYTPWGIRLYPILISLTIFTLATSLIAWYRQRRLPEEEKPAVSFRLRLSSLKPGSPLQIVLYIVLGVVLLGTLGTLGYVAALPKGGEGFTQFYILGPEGKAENYPEELVVGTGAEVIVGIVNQEHETTTYHLELRINGVADRETEPLVLEHSQKWEEAVSFTMDSPGDNQRVEFVLYRDGEPYLEPLHLWIDVIEGL